MTSIRASMLMFVFAVVGTVSASGQRIAQIYIANEYQQSLQQLNFTTGALTNLYTTAPEPDDLIVNSSGQLIYSLPNSGTVESYDPVTKLHAVLASGIPQVRDLAIEPGKKTMLIAKHASPPEIIRYTFSSGTWTVLVPKASFGTGGTVDGVAYDAYGNLYAVANHHTIIQINPGTGAILATLVTEPHNGVNGGDGLTYDSYSNSLWATHDGKVLGDGLIQIPVQRSGFKSTTSSGFTFFSTPALRAPDGIKSDGAGNLYIGSIHTAAVYNIPTNSVTYNIVTKGADGVALVPGTY